MSDSLPPVDYLILGHITHDRQSDGAYTLGGTATYAALTAAALGRRVGLVTSAGTDFDVTPFAQAGVSITCQPASNTTIFENHYRGALRVQRVHALAGPLLAEMVPASWRNAPIVHVGPVLDECGENLVAALAGRGFLGITPQGWLRQVAFHGRVARADWVTAARILPLASAVVLSSEDVGGDWELLRRWAALTPVLVVTQAQAGGVVYVAGEPYPFPAVPAVEIDPTGAGDIFAAVFFIALADGASPLDAAQRAAQLAALSVTRCALEGIPTRAEAAR